MKSVPINAKSVMLTSPSTVRTEMTLPDLERAFFEAGVTGFPVVNGEILVGVVSRSDVVRKLATEQSYAEYISCYHREICGAQDETQESLSALAYRSGTPLETINVGDIMSRNLISVSPEAPLSEVARLLVDRHIHRVIVTSGDKLEGVITSLDLVRLFADKRVILR